MATTPLPFFDRVEDDTEERVAVLLDNISKQAGRALVTLGGTKNKYYQDLKKVTEDEIAGWLSDDDIDPGTIRQLSLAMTNITLRAITKFSLATAEIVTFGETRGDIPVESTHQI